MATSGYNNTHISKYYHTTPKNPLKLLISVNPRTKQPTLLIMQADSCILLLVKRDTQTECYVSGEVAKSRSITRKQRDKYVSRRPSYP